MNKRSFPLKIEGKQAVLRRFVLTRKKKEMIEAEIARDLSGYNGETMLDYHLRVYKEDPNIRIYNDLYFDNGNPFQIDTLIYTSSFFLTIDSKNIDGVTKIEPQFQQGVQNNTYGQRKRLPNPMSQAKRHSFLSMKLLQKYHIYGLPIEALVANCNPTGILTADMNNPAVARTIVNVEMIPHKIDELRKKYTKHILSPSDIAKVHQMIVVENKPYLIDIEKDYSLSNKGALKGVGCPKCGKLGMVRLNGCWHCFDCGEISATAHERAIRDYFLLVKPTITVSECCEFLGIKSRHVAKRLLKKMNLRSTGNTKGTIYYSPWYKL